MKTDTGLIEFGVVGGSWSVTKGREHLNTNKKIMAAINFCRFMNGNNG